MNSIKNKVEIANKLKFLTCPKRKLILCQILWRCLVIFFRKKKKNRLCFIALDKVNYEEMHYDLAIAI